MGDYCTTDKGKPGKSATVIGPMNKGRFMKIIIDAGIPVVKGKVLDRLTPANCARLGKYMAAHQDKWVEPGKNPKLTANGLIGVHLLRTDVPEDRRNRLETCKDIIEKSLSSL